MYIIFIFPRYVSCSSFRTSRLSPSIYKFSVVSKSTLSALHGLNVADIGELAARMLLRFSGQVNWYRSVGPSTTTSESSCRSISKSMARTTFPPFMVSVTQLGKSKVHQYKSDFVELISVFLRSAALYIQSVLSQFGFQ